MSENSLNSKPYISILICGKLWGTRISLFNGTAPSQSLDGAETSKQASEIARTQKVRHEHIILQVRPFRAYISAEPRNWTPVIRMQKYERVLSENKIRRVRESCPIFSLAFCFPVFEQRMSDKKDYEEP